MHGREMIGYAYRERYPVIKRLCFFVKAVDVYSREYYSDVQVFFKRVLLFCMGVKLGR